MDSAEPFRQQSGPVGVFFRVALDGQKGATKGRDQKTGHHLYIAVVKYR